MRRGFARPATGPHSAALAALCGTRPTECPMTGTTRAASCRVTSRPSSTTCASTRTLPQPSVRWFATTSGNARQSWTRGPRKTRQTLTGRVKCWRPGRAPFQALLAAWEEVRLPRMPRLPSFHARARAPIAAASSLFDAATPASSDAERDAGAADAVREQAGEDSDVSSGNEREPSKG